METSRFPVLVVLTVIVLALTTFQNADASPFVPDSSAVLTGVEFGSLSWGDYDNDNDLDILLTGNSISGAETHLYSNSAGMFTDSGVSLPGLTSSTTAWGDYDRDGDLDFLMAGFDGVARRTLLYRNEAGAFAQVPTPFPQVDQATATWGDYDNDGDLDLALTGFSDSGPVATIFKNTGGTFSDLGAGLIGMYSGSAAWGDYDNDGDLDLLLAGQANAGRIARIYRNQAGAFSDILAGLPGVSQSSVAWGDYDQDGDLDVALTGLSNSGRISKVFRNNAGVFADAAFGFLGVYAGSVAWGDQDQDGDLDLLLSGLAPGPVTRLYRNDGSAFVNLNAGVQAVGNSSLAWGDYDSDGDLDILLCGSGDQGPFSGIYRNDASTSNTPPAAPGNPTVQVIGTTAIFSWNAATDAQTASQGLTYNLRVGTTQGGSEVMPGMADPATGFRRVVRIGNAGQRLSQTFQLPALGIYYWSVQAIDASYAGSAASEQTLQTSFMESGIGLEPVENSAAAWGDYDNDGDLDLLSTGSSACCGKISRVYRNDAGSSFVDISAGLPGVEYGAVAWGDYDSDGDLDFVLAGNTDCCGRISRIYRNNGNGSFTNSFDLEGTERSALAWADYDNDGDLDLLLTGISNGNWLLSYLYQNTNGSFDVIQTFENVAYGSVTWGDQDGDGDLDILLTGFNGGSRVIHVYRNNGGGGASFGEIPLGLEGVQTSSAAWGDYDADGDLDILLAGLSNCCGRIARIYTYASGSYTYSNLAVGGFEECSAAWGDYDQDGDLDIAISGTTDSGRETRVYRNTAGIFADISAGLDGVSYGTTLWGDYDNDGDLDLLITGLGASGRTAKVYRNNSLVPNTPPAPPPNLSASISGTVVTFSWSPASDSETPSLGLTYGLRIGTSPGASNVLSPSAASGNGFRRLVQMGNVNERTSWTVRLPGPKAYYWSVQAVDTGYRGSAFATEQSFLTSFTEVASNFEPVGQGSSSWGDYDNDGDLDLLVTGNSNSVGINSRIYRNDAGAFVNINAGLVGVYESSTAWGDYDRDGDLDIVLTGYSNSGRTSRVYRNQAGTFTDLNAGLEGAYAGSVEWGDVDNDGDLDILLVGDSNCCGAISWVYENQNGSFTHTATMQSLYSASGTWGDFDNDHDLDILLTGSNSIYVYANQGNGGFSNVGNLGMNYTYDGDAAWGDYDNDGKLDILLTGYAGCCGRVTKIYRNLGGSFSDIGANIIGVQYSSGVWGDYDNDGDLDVLMTGASNATGYSARIYSNQSGTFTDINAGIQDVSYSSGVWGDYDNDGDLDFFLTGNSSAGGMLAKLYRNNSTVANVPPSSPANTGVSVVVGGSATFTWDPATDAQTPTAGLTYNLRVGTTPGGADVMSTMADAVTGFRRVAQLGNTNNNTSWAIPLSSIPLTSPIYFSVQAIDHAFAGSAFSAEKVFGAMPEIQSISDVSNDQGKQVRIQWRKSFLDAAAASPRVNGYAVWRRVNPDSSPLVQVQSAGPARGPLPGGAWDFVTTIPARGEETYSVVVPTLCDSTDDGQCYSAYLVSGTTDDPHTFYDSTPDSGFSVDNLAPAAPQNLLARAQGQAGVALSWTKSEDSDFDYYIVYRANTPGVQPLPANRIGYTTDPTFQNTVEEGVYYYVVTAVDFSGNQGPTSHEVIVNLTVSGIAPTQRNALHRARPNPFSASTLIAFELEKASPVKLVIYDLRGKRIRTLVDEVMPVGVHEAAWDGRSEQGVPVASGEYFYQIAIAGFVSERKVTLAR